MAQLLLLWNPLSPWRTHTNCSGHGLTSKTIQYNALERRKQPDWCALVGTYDRWPLVFYLFWEERGPYRLVSPAICTIKTPHLTPGNCLAWPRALLNAWHRVASSSCWLLSIVHLFSQAVWSRDWAKGSPTIPHRWLLAVLLSSSPCGRSSPGSSGVRRVSFKE